MLIRTERLVLRDFVASDRDAVHAYQRDPRYLRFYPWRDRTENDATEFVGRFLEWQLDSPRYRLQLCVCLADRGEVIGNVGLRQPETDAGVAELGFELAPDRWGMGYATEAAGRLVRFGFEEWKLHRISAHCIAANNASARVLEKLGMRQEGRLRESEFFKGRWWDVLLFGLLQSEYRTASHPLGG
jgi:[ribosomal protein S5]-alanine N-acetyltransferase